MDNEIINSMLQMGFKDKNETISQLSSEDNNIETVLYLLLLDRKKREY